MKRNSRDKCKIHEFCSGALLLTALLLTAVTLALSADERKAECLASAGTGEGVLPLK
jgi:hypothetical protein